MPLGRKTKFALFSGVLLILIGVGLYFWIKTLQSQLSDTQKQLDIMTERAETAEAGVSDFETAQSLLKQEMEDCKAYVSQAGGNFDRFQYCQSFMNFYPSLNLE